MRKMIFIILILSLLSINCKSDSTGQYTYQQPENINDGFDVGSLDDVNIDLELIEKAVGEIYRGTYKELHSLLIYKDNRLVFEEYFTGHTYKWDAPNHHGKVVNWNTFMLHDVKSVTKSITSTCIGIAIDHGFIESVHQSIFEYLPEHQQFKIDEKDTISIEHLLTMTSGLKWDEWGVPLSSTANDIISLWFHYEDPIVGVLEKPLIKAPGTNFTYSGGNIIVLGEIIKNATKMKIDEFSGKYLFDPLEIDSPNWSLQYKNGVIESAGSLELTSRDMMKIGVMFLNKGMWNGKQIVSEKWVEKSSHIYKNNKNIKIPGDDLGNVCYGYTWWIKEFTNSGKKITLYLAYGWGGQKIIIIPDLNTVIVFTGGNYLSKIKQFKLLKKLIIPSLMK